MWIGRSKFQMTMTNKQVFKCVPIIDLGRPPKMNLSLGHRTQVRVEAAGFPEWATKG